MKPVLDVKDLCKTFAQKGKSELSAVRNVSFRLFPGEVLGLVGGSGSGKSTLAKLITRLIEPTSGSVFFNGRDVTKAAPSELRDIYKKLQMVFQTPTSSLDPRMTLGNSISESLRNHGMKKDERRKKTEKLLVQCGLPPEYARRYPHEVSTGESQRAAVARALAAEPEVLILDEATSSLDVMVQAQILRLLSFLKNEYGLSYLFISHNLALVQLFCDRMLVMHAGRLIEEGKPDDVILHPKEEYTKLLINSVI